MIQEAIITLLVLWNKYVLISSHTCAMPMRPFAGWPLIAVA